MGDRLLKAALYYVEHYNWYVFPLRPKGKTPLTPHGFKDASNDPEQIKTWWSKWPNANIGLDCGRSQVVVVDIDVKNVVDGLENWKELKEELDLDDDTLTCITGSGGQHIYYQAPTDVVINNSAGSLDGGIDVRAVGGYVILPPSIHPNGKPYAWELSSSPENCGILPFPQALIAKLRQTKDKPKPKILENQKILSGKRNDVLFRKASVLRGQGFSQGLIEKALIEFNNDHCHPPLEKLEVVKIAESASKYPPNISNLKPDYHNTDTGNAEMFKDIYGDRVRYLKARKDWFIWTGIRWHYDEIGKIGELAIKTIKEMYKQAIKIEDSKKREKRIKNALAAERGANLNSMIKIARSFPEIAAHPDEFDKNLMLFNCENCTIDLTTGNIREHKQADCITKLAPVTHDLDAQCPMWLKFLNEIMNHNANLIEFLQRMVGYSLTGQTSEQSFFILYGKGSNGKTTFVNVIMHLFGDYAEPTETDRLMVKKESGIPNNIAALKGLRLVTAAEASSNKRLSEALIKQLTGGDKITARFLRGEYFSFYPTFKIWFFSNHMPVIRDTDHAIWRRVRLIPFEVTILKDQQDEDLPNKLITELPGILNWAIEGSLAWQKHGLMVPDEVNQATKQYREEEDILGDYLATCIEIDENGNALFSELYQYYKDWAEGNGERVFSATKFGKLLKERGFTKDRKMVNGQKAVYYKGLRIKVGIGNFVKK